MTYHEGIEACFPDYFSRFTLPPQARPQELFVYRACIPTRLADQGSFLNSYEADGCLLPETINDPADYSLSVYLKLNGVKRFCVIDGNYDPPFPMAKGYTAHCCGVCCPTADWKEPDPRFRNRKKKGSHVDWWLYRDARPWEHFEVTTYEAEYEYLSQRAKGAGAAGVEV